MASNNRVFISFAAEDVRFRDFLVGQGRNERTPFSFVDMSVKEPWDSAWKTNCRTKIKGCDGMIALLSPKTLNADGARWEIRCAKEEGIRVMGMYVQGACSAPPELSGVRVVDWTWNNIKSFLDSL